MLVNMQKNKQNRSRWELRFKICFPKFKFSFPKIFINLRANDTVQITLPLH